MLKVIFLAFLLAILPITTRAQSVTVLTGPTIFYKYGSPGAAGSDVPGCGTSPSNACATCNYLWSQLVTSYDLNGHQVMVQFSGNNHPDGCQLVGRPRGQTNPRQIEFIGVMSNPFAVLLDPQNGGDAFSCVFDCEVAIGGFSVRNNGTGQGELVAAQSGRIMTLGEVVSYGSPSRPTIFNDMTAGLFGIIEIAHPDASPDVFGVQADGNYWFYGSGQCAFDAGDQGEIIADGNGDPNVFNFHWMGQTYSAGTGCANNHGVVQLENIHHIGSVSGREYDILTGGTIDAATTGLPHSAPGIFTPDPGFTGP